MDLDELKALVTRTEDKLEGRPFVEVCRFAPDARIIHVCLTHRLCRRARRGRVWKSPALLTALKNAAYGFRTERPRSRGGMDGIFRIDRGHVPRNAMMSKLFEGYLDKANGEAEGVAAALGVLTSDLIPVRLVSHHMRLLGVFAQQEDDWLVLVDYDDTK